MAPCKREHVGYVEAGEEDGPKMTVTKDIPDVVVGRRTGVLVETLRWFNYTTGLGLIGENARVLV